MKRLLFVLTLITLACGSTAPRHLDLYPTETTLPTQTARVVVISATPDFTPQPAKIPVQTATFQPIPHCFTVSATVAVFLRPSPSTDNYPIMPIPNGVQVHDLGGRIGIWDFVALGDKQGWVNSEYLNPC